MVQICYFTSRCEIVILHLSCPPQEQGCKVRAKSVDAALFCPLRRCVCPASRVPPGAVSVHCMGLLSPLKCLCFFSNRCVELKESHSSDTISLWTVLIFFFSIDVLVFLSLGLYISIFFLFFVFVLSCLCAYRGVSGEWTRRQLSFFVLSVFAFFYAFS